jgi:hypothetical protein
MTTDWTWSVSSFPTDACENTDLGRDVNRSHAFAPASSPHDWQFATDRSKRRRARAASLTDCDMWIVRQPSHLTGWAWGASTPAFPGYALIVQGTSGPFSTNPQLRLFLLEGKREVGMVTGLHDIAGRSTTAQDIMRAVFRAPTDRAAVTAALDWRREWESGT